MCSRQTHLRHIHGICGVLQMNHTPRCRLLDAAIQPSANHTLCSNFNLFPYQGGHGNGAWHRRQKRPIGVRATVLQVRDDRASRCLAGQVKASGNRMTIADAAPARA
jgi:hypothetical protein